MSTCFKIRARIRESIERFFIRNKPESLQDIQQDEKERLASAITASITEDNHAIDGIELPVITLQAVRFMAARMPIKYADDFEQFFDEVLEATSKELAQEAVDLVISIPDADPEVFTSPKIIDALKQQAMDVIDSCKKSEHPDLLNAARKAYAECTINRRLRGVSSPMEAYYALKTLFYKSYHGIKFKEMAPSEHKMEFHL